MDTTEACPCCGRVLNARSIKHHLSTLGCIVEEARRAMAAIDYVPVYASVAKDLADLGVNTRVRAKYAHTRHEYTGRSENGAREYNLIPTVIDGPYAPRWADLLMRHARGLVAQRKVIRAVAASGADGAALVIGAAQVGGRDAVRALVKTWRKTAIDL